MSPAGHSQRSSARTKTSPPPSISTASSTGSSNRLGRWKAWTIKIKDHDHNGGDELERDHR